MKKIIKIRKMNCEHCVKKITESLETIENINQVEIDLKTGKATIELSEEVKDSLIKKTIEDLGYQVKNIKEEK